MPPRTTRLSVNLNKVALLRNARDVGVPSVEKAARLALDAGAHGITVHPRPDGRHIRAADVLLLAELILEYPERELNIEGNPFSESGSDPHYPGFLSLVENANAVGRVHQVTFVPDAPDQATSDHGWDLESNAKALSSVVERLERAGVRISLFVDPEENVMAAAAATGASRVELYTEPYARAASAGDHEPLDAYVEAALAAEAAGLEVNAGHDLNLENLGPFLDKIPGIREVSIGHALTADALWMGLEDAVRAYLDITAGERPRRW